MKNLSDDSKVVLLRPHHFMCVHSFEGKGYSPAFVKNFYRVLKQLTHKNAKIKVVSNTQESICGVCPNNLSSHCVYEVKVQALDLAYKNSLNLKNGDEFTWSQLQKHVAESISEEIFEKNCEPCEWKSLGVCKKALLKLKNNFLVLLLGGLVGFFSQPSLSLAGLTVDDVEQNLLIKKTNQEPIFFELLQKENFSDDKKLEKNALKLLRTQEFKEYGYYFLALATRLQIKKNLEKKTTKALAEKALNQLNLLNLEFPATALQKKAQILSAEIELILAEALIKNKKPKEALALYERSFLRYSQASMLVLVKRSSLVNYLNLCDLNSNQMCLSWLYKLAPFQGKNDLAKRIDKLLEKNSFSKKPQFEKTVQLPYKTDLDLQLFQKGFQEFLAEKYANAFILFRQILTDYPKTTIKLRTKFWMARSAQKANFLNHAETLYREIIKELPFSYYGLMASWYSQIDVARMIDSELPEVATSNEILSPLEIIHLKKAEILIASNANDLAIQELKEIKPNASMTNEFLVYLTQLNYLAGNHLAAFQLFGELSSRAYLGLYSSFGEKILFPTAHWSTIKKATAEFKADPFLVISIMKQESAFNFEAVSVSNAYGLMQIIAPTARDLKNDLEVLELFDPETNVRLGSKYIQQLLSRYKGNVIAALAAYNAGPGHSDRWLREANLAKQNLAAEEYIELIGFRETREYVQNILRNYNWYRKRIDGTHYGNLNELLKEFKR